MLFTDLPGNTRLFVVCDAPTHILSFGFYPTPPRLLGLSSVRSYTATRFILYMHCGSMCACDRWRPCGHCSERRRGGCWHWAAAGELPSPQLIESKQANQSQHAGPISASIQSAGQRREDHSHPAVTVKNVCVCRWWRKGEKQMCPQQPLGNVLIATFTLAALIRSFPHWKIFRFSYTWGLSHLTAFYFFIFFSGGSMGIFLGHFWGLALFYKQAE